MDIENHIDEEHRKELLRFLLVKTAAVRRGVKPAELLRVRHCYSGVNSEGLRVCLYRSDIYVILGLDYVELKVEAESSLVLFYNPAALERTLAEKFSRRWLARLGYGQDWTTAEMLEELKRRAATCLIPHEVGLFIGYPLKDVVGFMERIPSTPVHNATCWRVYGNADESLRRMSAYRREEASANEALDRAKGVSEFIELIAQAFTDSFCVAAETIAGAAKDAGATLVGEVLKLDDTNEPDKTGGKVAAWVSAVKAAI